MRNIKAVDSSNSEDCLEPDITLELDELWRDFSLLTFDGLLPKEPISTLSIVPLCETA
jgi:hypothetical protein